MTWFPRGCGPGGRRSSRAGTGLPQPGDFNRRQPRRHGLDPPPVDRQMQGGGVDPEHDLLASPPGAEPEQLRADAHVPGWRPGHLPPRTKSRPEGGPGGRCQASGDANVSTISRSRTVIRARSAQAPCGNFLYGFKGTPSARHRPGLGPDTAQKST